MMNMIINYVLPKQLIPNGTRNPPYIITTIIKIRIRYGKDEQKCLATQLVNNILDRITVFDSLTVPDL